MWSIRYLLRRKDLEAKDAALAFIDRGSCGLYPRLMWDWRRDELFLAEWVTDSALCSTGHCGSHLSPSTSSNASGITIVK